VVRKHRLIGWYKGGLVFPVYDVSDQLVSIHYRTPIGKWKYEPLGNQMHPLVIRGSAELTACYDYESQWDAFAIIDRLKLLNATT
jgi:hypothetical protein